MVTYTIVKGGMALFAIIFVSLVILPIMADFAYGPTMNWDGITGNAGESARDVRDQTVQIYQWFSLFLAALVVVWMIWSSVRKDPTVEEAEW
jgi:hypothetical protein